ncbi:MAG: 3-deoxy-D-manno-octulosonic acid transferase [Candidatus Omnitrophica bacterium]|nr:3-deoxy-D-manno-octulosonic acid transferase [Candidatus Omnitrophota bacterium]
MILDILYLIYFILYFPVLILRGKWHKGFAHRFGFLPATLVKALSAQRNIWVHAVSVGEVSLVEGIIKGLKGSYPEHRIVLSVTTKTGHEFAARKYGDGVLLVWAPLDLSWVVRRWIKVIKPRMYVAAETELWPNLFKALDLNGIPVILVNGRISDAAYPRYRRISWILRKTTARLSLVCAQSHLDAGRFKVLGVRPDRVYVAGNVKFDLVLPALLPSDVAKKEFGLDKHSIVWVAASTHPGEEAAVLNAFKAIRVKFPLLRLVIVPRHPERAGEIAALIQQHSLSSVLLTQRQGKRLGADDVLLGDAVGYLMGLYQAADIVFIGKSLGISRRGGQNPIEAASMGKPVIVGPCMENFKDIVRLFTEASAIVEINSVEELSKKVEDLLAHPEKMAGFGARARVVADNNRGAVQRTIARIRQMV